MCNGTQHFAVVQCGSAKVDGEVPAREKYSSGYFAKKRGFGDRFCQDWFVLSAKFGILRQSEPVPDYDMTPDDHSVEERDQWIAGVREELLEYDWPDGAVLWVLVGDTYMSKPNSNGVDLNQVFAEDILGEVSEVKFPFRQTGGSGFQMGWLNDCLKGIEPKLPGEMPGTYRRVSSDESQTTLKKFD